MTLKPHLACDIDLATVKFPLIGMPKIDGVRGLFIKSGENPDGLFTGRSLKQFKNKFVAKRYEDRFLLGLDGELTLGAINRMGLCRETTGFLGRKTAKPGKPVESEDLRWNIFDYLGADAVGKPYVERLHMADDIVHGLARPDVRMVEWTLIQTLEQYLEFHENCLNAGFEGSILRCPDGMHKDGRASSKGKTPNAYIRNKPFVDFEFTITALVEANENTNEKKTNELGQSERSSHKAGMKPKGMVGMVQGIVLKDVKHLGKVILKEGQQVDVGPGEMPHAEREAFWAYRESKELTIVGLIGKGKFFAHDNLDKPRMATWVSLRDAADMS